MSDELILVVLLVLVSILVLIVIVAIVGAVLVWRRYGQAASRFLRSRLGGRAAVRPSAPPTVVAPATPGSSGAARAPGGGSAAPAPDREPLTHGDVPADDPRIVALGLEEPTSTDAVLRNLTKVKPLLRAEASESDRIGRTTPLAGGALRATGVFRWCFPVERGGLGASYADRLEAVTQVSRIDAGMGWIVMWISAHGELTSILDEEAYGELYPSIDLPTVFSTTPMGRAVEIAGDMYRIEPGRWRLGSGGYHADRWMGGATVWTASGNPVIDESTGEQKSIAVWLPADKVRQDHDWDPLGVRSSGSSSYYLPEAVEVPRRWTYNLDDQLRRPIFFPFMGVAVGAAQHLVDLTLEALRKKRDAGAEVGAHDRSRLTQALALLDMLVFGLRGYAEYLDAARDESGWISRPDSAWFETAGLSVYETVTKIRDITSDIYGTGYVPAGSEFARVLRDLQVAVAHGWFRGSDTSGNRRWRVDMMLDDPEVRAVWDERVPTAER